MATAGTDMRMKILIAVDEGSESKDAIAFAKRMLPADADVIVLNVAQYSITPYGTMSSLGGSYGDAVLTADALDRSVAEADAEAERTVHEASTMLDHADERIEHGDAGPKICEVAADESVDLVVLGTHQRSRWARLWFGSVSDHVVHNAPCPVMVVRS